MFVIRQARIEDVGTLMKLARMVHFINLPPDKDIITAKVLRSRSCFLRAAGGAESYASAASLNGKPRGRKSPKAHTAATESAAAEAARVAGLAGLSASSSDMFMFVLEDTENSGCLGTSQIIARMGGPGNPNYSLKLSKREFFSQSLQTGTSHIVAKLHADESGPSEIGGLILQPASRGHKLGRFLSLVRFHFAALHRSFFSDRVIAEMMAPITMDGQNMLWEYFGRRFIPLSYVEADKHCQRSREFISALLPREEIYLSLLPPEARDVVGRVGEETVPARRMLEKLGFRSNDTVDPFDGGPHLEAKTDDIRIVRDTVRAKLGPAVPESACNKRGFVSVLTGDGEFRAVDGPVSVGGRGSGGVVAVPAETLAALGVDQGTEVGVTPIEPFSPAAPGPSNHRQAAGGRPRRKVRA